MTKHCAYRLQGFTCPKCGDVTLVFGKEPAPVACNCGDAGALPVKSWDKWIEESVVSSEYQNQDSPPPQP